MTTEQLTCGTIGTELPARQHDLPGQIVLVLQGGGALGAFQAGVYEAMHEAGIEPDWVVGTSIGAINGAIIAGNPPQERMPRLQAFWDRVASGSTPFTPFGIFGLDQLLANFGTVMQGIPGFFTPNPRNWFDMATPVGIAAAGFYTTAPLRETLAGLIDFRHIGAEGTRLTLGAVNARSGRMHYFDSRDEALAIDHIMASGALPPAFPAIMIGGEPYWDGGVYSNTPIEVVMDDARRRNSVIFAAQLWQQEDDDPETIQQVISRMKDIQYSSRHASQVSRQQQIHHLRHVVRELGKLLPESEKAKPEIQELMSWGCGTVMHIISLRAPRRDGEDGSKDIDFTPASICARWEAGRALTRAKIAEAPWRADFDPVMGVLLHE